ncbi:transglutaminase-like domain-containing protein [Methanolobus sp. WCC5]|uniref:transglutaminase-like domain-containing protein n=1 Tax=Methanolobus sp. WCC5 TaxID=3125785 RepID=UPI0032493505
MDLKSWFIQKRNLIPIKLDYKSNYTKAILLIMFSVMAILLCVFFLLIQAAYSYSIYNLYAADHIDAYLNKTSENILLQSSNDIEIAQNIVKWQRQEFALVSGRFKATDFLIRHISGDPGWYLFLNKGNCGEFAIVFEDMANRTGMTSRNVRVDGFIHFNGGTENHAWSEVLINDSEWYVADSGFNYSPPLNNYFGYSKSRLLGPVYVFENGIQSEDRTVHYIPNTETIMIKSINDGEIVPNCTITIKMNHNGTSKKVVGTAIKLKTNESGLCFVTLGVYNNTSYTVKAIDGMNQGNEEIISGNNTGYIEIEIQKPNPLAVIALLILIVINIIIWKPMLRKKSDIKEKHKKL